MVEASSTKTYLKDCHVKVVVRALANGLDMECYYHYLLEIYRAVTCDSGVRRKYQRMLTEVAKEVSEWHRTDGDKDFPKKFGDIFQKRCDFMVDLLKFASDGNVIDDETQALAKAQIGFAEFEMHEQERYLDTVQYFADLNIEEVRKSYEDARMNCSMMVAELAAAATTLDVN